MLNFELFRQLSEENWILIRFLVRHDDENANEWKKCCLLATQAKKKVSKNHLVPKYSVIQPLALLATFLCICRWLDSPKRPVLIVPPEWVSHSMTCLSKSHRIALRFGTFVGNKSSLKIRWAERIRFCIVLPNRPNFQREYPIGIPSKRQPN